MMDDRLGTTRDDGATSVRLVRDDDGRWWRVREFVSSFDRRARPSLVFETDDMMRRVREYPAGWMSLSDGELLALTSKRP